MGGGGKSGQGQGQGQGGSVAGIGGQQRQPWSQGDAWGQQATANQSYGQAQKAQEDYQSQPAQAKGAPQQPQMQTQSGYGQSAQMGGQRPSGTPAQAKGQPQQPQYGQQQQSPMQAKGSPASQNRQQAYGAAYRPSQASDGWNTQDNYGMPLGGGNGSNAGNPAPQTSPVSTPPNYSSPLASAVASTAAPIVPTAASGGGAAPAAAPAAGAAGADGGRLDYLANLYKTNPMEAYQFANAGENQQWNQQNQNEIAQRLFGGPLEAGESPNGLQSAQRRANADWLQQGTYGNESKALRDDPASMQRIMGGFSGPAYTPRAAKTIDPARAAAQAAKFAAIRAAGN